MNNPQLDALINSVLSDPRFILLVVWAAFWKGLALWHASGRNQVWWFVIVLFVNTLGVLEIIYLFMVLHLTFRTLFSKHRLLEEEVPQE